MTLKEYAKYISTLAKKNPTAKVVYASDDEGNDYKEIVYQPSLTELSDEFKSVSDGKTVCCVN